MDSTQDYLLYKGHILVIDDTPANLRLLVNLLKNKGYNVRALPNGKLALAAIKNSPPDLVLLDIMMPEMDGYEVCEQLKADETTRDIPVIFISAINDVIDKVKAFTIGGIDYVTKPFQVEEVLARVETHLENRMLHRSLQQKNDDLARALAELQSTQNQLIQSEKMAALGQLIASIAHEINTPLGAIRASSENTKLALQEFLQDLPQLLNLSEDQQIHLFTLLGQATQHNLQLSTKEQRQLKRQLTEQLVLYQIDSVRNVAEMLADLQIYNNLEPLLPWLRSPNRDWIFQVVYNLTRLQSNSQNTLMAVERAAKTVFALKSYSRYNQNNEKQLAQLSESIETVLQLYRSQLQQGVEVVRTYDSVGPILCHPNELDQVWINLIHNAIQAMEGKGILEINVSEQNRYQVVSITDSGCGIPVSIQDKIFEPFFTTKSVGEGSGLGLDIVRKIVEKHQGKINFESVSGQTTFKVWLPITVTQAPSLESKLSI
ncbi:MAG: hybrid sensor histidine kinase/response regulator [Microcoleaceae cyanobacterium]